MPSRHADVLDTAGVNQSKRVGNSRHFQKGDQPGDDIRAKLWQLAARRKVGMPIIANDMGLDTSTVMRFLGGANVRLSTIMSMANFVGMKTIKVQKTKGRS